MTRENDVDNENERLVSAGANLNAPRKDVLVDGHGENESRKTSRDNASRQAGSARRVRIVLCSFLVCNDGRKRKEPAVIPAFLSSHSDFT